MKKTRFVILVIIFFLVGYLVIDQWLSYEDNPLTQAKRIYPLGNGNPYIIVKTDGTGAEKITIPYIYAIIKPNETLNSASLSWRRIGQSAINLDQYIGKKVYIKGEYYMGMPFFIQIPEEDPYGLTFTQPVIKITNLTLVP